LRSRDDAALPVLAPAMSGVRHELEVDQNRSFALSACWTMGSATNENWLR
jgi:hypothetical protein